MAEFNWDNSLSVGVIEMDNQHKVLIDFINKLVDQIGSGDNAVILQKFDELSGYVVKHFEEEEALMDKFEFSGVTTHKLIHKQLLERVGEFRDKIVANSLDGDELVRFLKVWLTSHIKGIDIKYGNEINQKKAA
ncbi:bacteriohemerythrin [Bacteriovorax sp. Seq25_V]|uniref:bacteriohemerythrin n=1 Tax=Bacteriovorax sp. Seq25_V TaxID=1201288 RepID=UPI000389E224|nr:bacteriohemerythrin [Bacteriovorax sp. Seq25_V]EQC47521.1 hemerythrin family non-heme iron protein [Bacteriovorax sp. Seq25_V]